ncbi:MAG: M20/M25/M40 family metallo-hydrolase [Thermoanaerobaculales bacterium]|nr:M20/M25/M40 family metallo-hydrolase [Thermoanaerobaculales bacterium]
MSVRAAGLAEAVVASTVDLLEELCAISSASGDRAGLYAVAERLGSELACLGLVPELHAEPGIDGEAQPVLVARGPGVGERSTLLVGHLDTVLPAVPPRRCGDRLEGTGALDMKGGLAAFVGALRALRARGEEPPEDLVLVAVPDEEVGGPISVRSVRHWGGAAHTVLVLEPGLARGDGETLVTGRRGLTTWRLDGRGTAAHSGVAYWEGRSALAAAATWAGAVQRMSERGDGPVVNVGRIVGGDSEFVSDVGEEHRFIGTSERLNIVADRCLVEGEIRHLAAEDCERFLARMRDLADDLARGWGVELELAEIDRIPPMAVSAASAGLADHLVRAAAADGWRLELEPNRGGVSFPNFLPDPAAVCVVDGLGPVGDGMHTRREYLDLGSLRRRIALIAEALVYVRDRGGK